MEMSLDAYPVMVNVRRATSATDIFPNGMVVAWFAVLVKSTLPVAKSVAADRSSLVAQFLIPFAMSVIDIVCPSPQVNKRSPPSAWIDGGVGLPATVLGTAKAAAATKHKIR